MHSLVGSRPRPSKLPTEVGDTVTGPQDRGELHEDRAAEGASRCLPRLIPGCSSRGQLS
jgi:hypothetical protein